MNNKWERVWLSWVREKLKYIREQERWELMSSESSIVMEVRRCRDLLAVICSFAGDEDARLGATL
jgi:hypothetical protein